MVDRRLIGDIALAVLLAMPTLALARPQQGVPEQTARVAPMVEQAALADQSSTERRFSLDG